MNRIIGICFSFGL